MDFETENILQRWQFPWPIIDVLVAGRSAIDLPHLEVHSFKEADAFFKAYGFNPDHPDDARKIHGAQIEALQFIQTMLMPKEWKQGKKPPKVFFDAVDPRQLLIWASGDGTSEEKAWSCALLRIMHTIAHLEGEQRSVNIDEARKQIMGRFQSCLSRTASGQLAFGRGQHAVIIDHIQWKHTKTRSSILLKLLHKPGNVAETIYDILGVRIVTKSEADVMLVVKFLRDNFLLAVPNIHPARARNTLIDVPTFRREIEGLVSLLKKGKISQNDFVEEVAQLKAPLKPRSGVINQNPHSSDAYKAVQLTCRQRIVYRNPAWNWLQKLKTYAQSEHGDKAACLRLEEIISFVNSYQHVHEDQFISAFFPFEVQIMDHENYQTVIKGRASHVRYKQAQIKTARRRVLHDVLKL